MKLHVVTTRRKHSQLVRDGDVLFLNAMLSEVDLLTDLGKNRQACAVKLQYIRQVLGWDALLANSLTGSITEQFVVERENQRYSRHLHPKFVYDQFATKFSTLAF